MENGTDGTDVTDRGMGPESHIPIGLICPIRPIFRLILPSPFHPVPQRSVPFANGNYAGHVLHYLSEFFFGDPRPSRVSNNQHQPDKP